MSKLRLSILLFFFALSSPFLYSIDGNAIDSLRRVIEQTEGQEKIKAYADLYSLVVHGDDMQAELAVISELFEESHRQKDIVNEGLARIARLLCYYNYDQYADFEKLLPESLDFFKRSGLIQRYYYAIHLEVESYLYSNRVEKALMRCAEIYKEAKEANDAQGLALSSHCYAMSYRLQGRYDQAEPFFRESIRYAKQQEDFDRKVESLDKSYYMLATQLIAERRAEEALEIINEWNDLLAEDRRIALERGRLTSINAGRRFYCNLSMAKVLTLLERYEEAESYMKVAEDFAEGNQELVIANLNNIKSELYYNKGEYDKALALIDTCLQYYRNPPAYQDIYRLIRAKKDILMEQSRFEEACEVYQEIVMVTDSMITSENLRQLNELRTIYELDKISAEKEKNRLYFVIAIGGCLLLFFILILYIFYSHRLKKKNLSLYQQIQDRKRIEEEMENAITHIPEKELTREMKLYLALNELMKNERLFTDPDIDRKKLADRLRTNETYLANAIREGCGETFSSYIISLRLQYALKLLSNNPELTLDAIALESGYASYSPFFRAFSKQYGMSPSEYRKLSVTQKKI